MKWEPSVSCNGRFQDIFKNLEHLKIVNNDNEVPKKISRYNGQHSVPNVYKMYKVNINSYTVAKNRKNRRFTNFIFNLKI
jgi:hypothetical protein